MVPPPRIRRRVDAPASVPEDEKNDTAKTVGILASVWVRTEERVLEGSR